MNRLRFIAPVLALVAVPALGLSSRLAADEADSPYKKVVDSAVFIVTPYKNAMGMGSGSLIDKEKRYILTNYHVVGDQDKVYVQFPVYQKDGTIMRDKKSYIERIPAGQALRGTVLFRDKTRDLAIVQLDRLAPTAKQIKLAKSSADSGDRTWNIGSPGAVSQVFGITSGEVRVVGNEDFPVGGHGEIMRIKCRMVTATNPTNPGDSGGPLVNKAGEQVAVTESGDTTANAVNFFVDVMEVRAFLKEKKIVLPNDGPEDKVATKPKHGLDSDRPKIDAPPGKTPPTGTSPAPKVDAVPVPVTPEAGASPEDEKAASAMLQRAQLFADSDDKAYYAKKLQEVITKHPTTTAAKKAKKLLDAMK